MLETNTFGTGDEHIENTHSNFSHTHTHAQLATSDFQTDLCGDDCYSQVLISEKVRYHSLILTFEYATLISYICAIAFSPGLHVNGLQLYQVDREKNKQNSTYTLLIPSDLVVACNTCVQ